jgi:hypothetical protein
MDGSQRRSIPRHQIAAWFFALLPQASRNRHRCHLSSKLLAPPTWISSPSATKSKEGTELHLLLWVKDRYVYVRK